MILDHDLIGFHPEETLQNHGVKDAHSKLLHVETELPLADLVISFDLVHTNFVCVGEHHLKSKQF